MANASDAEIEGSEKARKVNRYFTNAKGEQFARAVPEADTVVHEWRESGHKLVMSLGDLNDDILRCAALFGVSQVVGNAYGGEKDETDAIDKGTDRWDTLASGNWATERASGPKFGDIVAAYEQVYAAAGKPLTEEAKAAFVEKLNSGVLDPKAAAQNDKIKAAMDAIKIKRMQDRMAKRQAAADTAELPAL